MSEIISSTYELIERIGSGGGGVVYLANHLRLGKKVVLKADKRKLTTRPELLRREVDVLKNLTHSYIPQVYDFFVENDTVYTAMDYIQGESLDKPLKRGERFSQAQVIKWAIQMLEALDYLHQPIHGDPPKGYVHSDIKPANLMKRPNNDICLIDFNIALAIGENNVVGCSIGYASPEHYGLDYSEVSGTVIDENETVTLNDETATITLSKIKSSSSNSKKRIMPDVRSDIYSVGATLYHLLSGVRPAKDALNVEKLSQKEFSPLIVKIISKAMEPNPNLRYQTAAEMLDDILKLRENDPRTKKLKKFRLITLVVAAVVFAVGLSIGFIGLKRMQTRERFLKLAEYSSNALQDGNSEKAIKYALEATSSNSGILTPGLLPEVQMSLTTALGVYDLADGYKSYNTIELPSATICMRLSPDGKTGACIYSGNLAIFDTEKAEIIETLPSDESALSEVEFIDNYNLCFAGKYGITVYNLASKETVWTGNKATSISVSSDGINVAGIYKDENTATIYDSQTGNILQTVDFNGRSQQVTTNDIFANPNDNLFEISNDGNLLAVSFSDGSLSVFNVANDDEIELYDSTSDFTHFEGGFYKEYFAYSASNTTKSVFAVIDVNKKEQIGGFNKDGYFEVQADETGIFTKIDNILVEIDPVSGEQTPLVNTSENIVDFALSGSHTMASYKGGVLFFDEKANLTSKIDKKFSCDFIQISEGVALIGSMDEPVICILKYENHLDSQVFSYDSDYSHDEARISADERTIMFFTYKQFRIYDFDNELICEVDIPNASDVYDQQFVRDGNSSYLEVTYYDGTIERYNARDGTKIYSEKGDIPDSTLYEEFYTDNYRIESPLHGTPKVYKKDSDEIVTELEEDAYLTYVTQVDDYVITQYITASGEFYGYLLNDKCEKIAYLPNLCDILNGKLIFDYPSTGDIRKSKIYNIDELISMAQNEIDGGI